jgi:hypothetical protein
MDKNDTKNKTITLKNADLSLLLPVRFGPRFGDQRVDVVSSQDKSGPEWAQETPNTGGFLKECTFTDGSGGRALIYVHAPLKAVGSSSKRIEVTSIATNQRQEVLMTLVHELAHVQQCWLHSPHYDEVYRSKGAYEKNVFELDAYRAATEFAVRNSQSIRQGRYDTYLPSWLQDADAGQPASR